LNSCNPTITNSITRKIPESSLNKIRINYPTSRFLKNRDLKQYTEELKVEHSERN